MIVELGNKGLENSFQAPFPENTACVHNCGGVALPIMSIMEDGKTGPKGDYICNLPRPKASKGSPAVSWPHDATAFTIYFCPECFGATALFNQA